MIGIGIRGLALTRIANAIKALFAAGEIGAWYDPSDLTTMFQDAAGTTPVTAAEQPVGLILDKSKGLVLGAELVVNGDFSNGNTGWGRLQPTTGTVDASSGAMRLYSADGTVASFNPNAGALTIGKTYRVTLTALVVSGTASFRRLDNGATIQSLFAGQNDFVFTAAHTNWSITRNTPCDITFDNISVRELPGNHATQTTATKRPVLSARVNLLTKTEDFSDAVWLVPAGTATKNAGNITATSVNATIWQLYQPTVGSPMTGRLEIKRKTGTSQVQWTPDASNFFTVDLSSGDWVPVSNTHTPTAGTKGIGIKIAASGDAIYVRNASLVVADQASLPYQRVNTATDYDTVGFPHYLKFDGIDDALVTGSIDFTATDKMTVVAGVRKLSDAATGVITELSSDTSANAGTFVLVAPRIGGDIGFRSRGSVVAAAFGATGFTAPITAVVTGLGDISGDSAILHVNGVQVATNTVDQGTGNYGNYPLYIGSRGGTSLPFNGHLYSLIVRGAQSTDAQITSAEAWVNNKTGAY